MNAPGGLLMRQVGCDTPCPAKCGGVAVESHVQDEPFDLAFSARTAESYAGKERFANRFQWARCACGWSGAVRYLGPGTPPAVKP